MSFIKQIPSVDMGTTSIENIFINDFMPTANGTHVKVYLMAYAVACDSTNRSDFDNIRLSKHLSIPLEDVLDAWSFWEKKNVIKKHLKEDDPYNFDVEFLSLRQLYIDNNYSLQRTPDSHAESNINALDLVEASKSLQIRQMFAECETFMQRNLFPNERKEILDYLYEFGVSPDFVVHAFEFAVEKKGIRKVKFAIGILKNWRDEGILNEEDLKVRFSQNQERLSTYRQIYQAMGYGNRQVSSGDKLLIDQWFDANQLSMDFVQAIIIEASTKTANLNMNYVDAYIQRRINAGIKTVESLNDSKLEATTHPKKDKIVSVAKSSKPNKFNDFKNNTQSYTNDELELLLGIRKK